MDGWTDRRMGRSKLIIREEIFVINSAICVLGPRHNAGLVEQFARAQLGCWMGRKGPALSDQLNAEPQFSGAGFSTIHTTD